MGRYTDITGHYRVSAILGTGLQPHTWHALHLTEDGGAELGIHAAPELAMQACQTHARLSDAKTEDS